MEGVDGFNAFREQHGLAGLMRCAERNIVQGVFRTDAGELQRFVKAGAKLAHERQRAAQVDDVALDGAALRQAGDGLVDHGHEDGAGHVRTLGALVE